MPCVIAGIGVLGSTLSLVLSLSNPAVWSGHGPPLVEQGTCMVYGLSMILAVSRVA